MMKHSLLAGCCLVTATTASAADFEFGGLLEFEYANTRTKVAGETNDQDAAYLATAEFGFGLKFNEHWRADLVLLAEDIENTDPDEFRPALHDADDPPDQLHVEELVLTYTRGDTDIYAGRFTLPFGDFGTSVITDPQTLEIGETKTSLGATVSHNLGHSWGNVNVQVTYFDGNLRNSAPDESGFAAGLEAQSIRGIRFGLGYLSSQGAGKDAPSLWNVYATGEQGAWNWHAEYVAATDEENGEKPRAWSLDAGYAFNDQWSAGARYQQTDRASVLEGGDGDYEEWAVAGFYSPWEHVSLGLEYANGEEGNSKADQWLMQVAVEF
jgi:hypothetical protein